MGGGRTARSKKRSMLRQWVGGRRKSPWDKRMANERSSVLLRWPTDLLPEGCSLATMVRYGRPIPLRSLACKEVKSWADILEVIWRAPRPPKGKGGGLSTPSSLVCIQKGHHEITGNPAPGGKPMLCSERNCICPIQ